MHNNEEGLYPRDFYLFDYVTDGICLIDKEYRVIFWNKVLENWTSIKRNKIINNKIFHFFEKLVEYKFIERLEEVLQGGTNIILSAQFHEYVIPCPLPNGRYRLQNVTITPFPIPDDKGFYALFVIQDATDVCNKLEVYKDIKNKALRDLAERLRIEDDLKNNELRFKKLNKELELKNVIIERTNNELEKLNERLKESQEELRELNANKDKLYTIVAHDLRGSFGGLMSITEFLSLESDSLSRTELKEILDNVHTAIKKVYGLLENLLVWARIQTGKLLYEPAVINIHQPVQDAVSLAIIAAQGKNVTIRSKVSEELYSFCDANIFSAVIRNLLSNAVKFTRKKGIIEVDAYEQGNEIVVSVSDNGIGISEEYFNEIFCVNSRRSTLGTEKETGTGLGLILCKELAEKNGGRIWAQSAVDKGSIFYFTIPSKDYNS
ncbi:MAG TPA: ATP-binding protein, partial [Ignavibacteriales bacterium]|nr:ATP-binding protein [Ignavibacteriales bacterium]